MKSIYGEKPKPFEPIEQIPEGGTLLLIPRSERVLLGDEIYAVKHDNAIYIELFDFINLLNFPIDYDPDTLTGAGWFLREDWEIKFDLNGGMVESIDTLYPVSEDDLYQEDGLTYIKDDALAKWFNMEFDLNIQQQILDITPPFPFPAVYKNARDNKFNKRNERQFRYATLPRMEQPRSNYSLNTADIAIGNRMEKRPGEDFENRQTYSVLAQGEFLKHNRYIFMSGDDRDKLTNIRTELFKRSENADLLGPLKARQYSLGDVKEVRIPLISQSEQNFGVQLSNSTLDNTDFATTDVEGTAFPGWDVQLYRNGILIDVQTVAADGQYLFEEIQLFAGENDFELFFLGPQGEIRLKTVSAPVSRELLQSQDGTYELSFTLNDTQTYRSNFTRDEDSNTPTVAAKYNTLIGENFLGYMGFKTFDLLGKRKVFASVGGTATIGETLLDTNLAIDEQAAASAQVLVRQKLLGWDTSFNTELKSPEFSLTDSLSKIVLSIAANAQRKIFINGYRTNFLLGALYQKNDDGGSSELLSAAVSNSLWRTNISNTLSYEKNADDVFDEGRIEHALGIRKSFGNFFLNTTSTYTISPESELSIIQAQLNYQYNNRLTSDFTYRRTFAMDEDRYRFNLNYTNDKFRLSPYVEYSSDNEVVGGFNLNFSLYDVPNSPYPKMTSKRLSGRGGVSAFVYHDKNGNEIFDNDDEPLPGTLLRSLNSRRQEFTDDDGYATIPDLQVQKATDIVVKSDDLVDPFMIPATQGASIIPVEGTFYKMEFPIHVTGEIDGMVYYFEEEIVEDSVDVIETKKGVPFQTIVLHSLDREDRAPIEVKTERDGYYVAFMIPPGRYLAMPAKTKKYGNRLPHIIDIGFEGTIIADINHELIKDGYYVPYEVSFAEDDISAGHYIKVKNKGVSKLSETLNNYLVKQAEGHSDLYKGLKTIKTFSDETGDYTYYDLESGNDNITLLHEECQNIIASGGACTIIIAGKAIR